MKNSSSPKAEKETSIEMQQESSNTKNKIISKSIAKSENIEQGN